MQLMLSEESQQVQDAYKLIKMRRLKGRDINGPVTMYMKEYKKSEKEFIKDKIVKCWECIEEVELHNMQIDEKNISDIERKVLKKDLNSKLCSLYKEYTLLVSM